MLGKKVLHTTLLVNPDEEDEVMPAAADPSHRRELN